MQDKQPLNKNGQRHGYWDFQRFGAHVFNGYHINGIAFGAVNIFWQNELEKRYYAR